MSILTFDRIEKKITVKGICLECNKKRSRVLKTCKTVNPFNKNDDGTIKTHREVSFDVSLELGLRRERLENEFYCSSCKYYLGY